VTVFIEGIEVHRRTFSRDAVRSEHASGLEQDCTSAEQGTPRRPCNDLLLRSGTSPIRL